jgi:hypothetical protein
MIAEDSVLLREGLARLLADGGVEVVAQVGDGPGLVAAADAYRPDLAVVSGSATTPCSATSSTSTSACSRSTWSPSWPSCPMHRGARRLGDTAPGAAFYAASMAAVGLAQVGRDRPRPHLPPPHPGRPQPLPPLARLIQPHASSTRRCPRRRPRAGRALFHLAGRPGADQRRLSPPGQAATMPGDERPLRAGPVRPGREPGSMVCCAAPPRPTGWRRF